MGSGSHPGRRAPQYTFFGAWNPLKMARATMFTFTLLSSAAPRFRRLKMARATTNTFNNNCGGGGGASTTTLGNSNSKRPTAILMATDTQTDRHTGIVGYRK